MSLPIEFLEKMQALLGQEYEEFLASYEQEKTVGIRRNPLKAGENFEQRMPFSLEKVAWAEQGYRLKDANGLRPGKHPFHDAGVYYIQEPSAMAPVEQLHVQAGERVLDLCAAPGGKSTQIAGKLMGEGFLLANEIHPARAQALSQNIERLGIANTVVTNEKPERLALQFSEYFHKVLVDAPCSGEGMFRKDDNAGDEWSLSHVEACAKRQQEVLDSAARLCMPGGRLVYSTCTFSPEEDEQIVEWFLNTYPEFELVEPDWYEGFSRGRQEFTRTKNIDVTKTIRLWPHKLHGEGHFMAVFQKHGEETIRRRSMPTCFTDKKKLGDYRKFEKDFLNITFDGNFVAFGEQLFLLPKEMLSLDKLKVVRPGLHLGTFLKNRFEPSHALALYLKKEQVKQMINLTWESEACSRYLHGETIACDDTWRGWVLVCCNGYSLGFGKANNGILKNHYPKGLRWM